jgi:hypothetical protein
VLGSHLDVRAHVEQQQPAARDRQHDGQRRAVDARQALHVNQRGRERRARRAGRHDRVRGAFPQCLGGPDDRRILARAGRLRGLVVVRDLVRSVDDLHLGSRLAERRADLALGPEEDAARPAGGGICGSGCDLGEAAIGAEGVYRDCCDGASEAPLSATT